MPANPDTWRAIRAELESLPKGEWSLFSSTDSPGWAWFQPDDPNLRARAMAIFLKAARTRGYDSADQLLDDLSNAEFVRFRRSGHGYRTKEDETLFHFDTGLLRDAVNHLITLCQQFEAECTPKEVPPPKPKGHGRKPGPKPDLENAARVAKVVATVAPHGDWRAKLDEVCEALDKEGILSPKRWRAKDRDLRQWLCWADCTEPLVAVKVIAYRLASAKKQRKAASTTR